MDSKRRIKQKNASKKGGRGAIQKRAHERPSPIWWGPEIEDLRFKTLKCRRMVTRERGKKTNHDPLKIQELDEIYKACRKELKLKICEEKHRCWRELCERLNLDVDVWADEYKVAMKVLTITGNKLDLQLDEDEKLEVISALFLKSTHTEKSWNLETISNLSKLSCDKLKRAVKKLERKTLTGPDSFGVPVAVKLLAEEDPECLKRIMDKLMAINCIPEHKKISKFVDMLELISNTDNQLEFYRPICLLDTMHKLFQNIVFSRLNKELKRAERFNENQYGLERLSEKSMCEAMSGLSTAEKAKFVLIPVNVKNASYEVSSTIIIKELERRGIAVNLAYLIGYLSEKSIRIVKDELMVTVSVSDESDLRPTLWNILNAVLEVTTSTEVTLDGADDIAVATALESKELEINEHNTSQ